MRATSCARRSPPSLGFIETLQGPARNDAAARERFLDIMRGQAQRMTRLIDDLLSLSRIEMSAHLAARRSRSISRRSLGQMVDTLSPLAQERGVAITLELPDEPVLVLGDRDELLRVVENLIENAIKYGESGGRCDVDVARIAAGAERRGADRPHRAATTAPASRPSTCRA